MITAIIIDDEPNAHGTIKKLLEKSSIQVNIVASAYSVSKAISLINKHAPDLIFLDIEMPDENGLQLLNRFNSAPFKIIITSAHEHYAIKAFKHNVIGYLLKPIFLNDLEEILKYYVTHNDIETKQSKFNALLENINTTPYQFNKLVLPNVNSYEVINLKDIVYCEADGSYTTVYLINHEKLMVSKLIKWFEEMLPSQTFFRIHKSHIVNLNLIKKIEKTEGCITMENDIQLVIAERVKKEFFNTILSPKQ